MRLAGLLKNVLGNRGRNISSQDLGQPPVFESLEPRVLLSADYLSPIHLDPHDTSSDLTPAIYVDLEYEQEQLDSVLEDTLETEAVIGQVELVIEGSEDESHDAVKDPDTALTTLENTGLESVKVVGIEVTIDSISDRDVPDSSPVSDQESTSDDHIFVEDQTIGSIDP
jgi:hypothetical protein